MSGRPKKAPREKDLTGRYFSGNMDEDRTETGERFKARYKTSQHDKMQKTALLRVREQTGVDLETLPIGEVVQVFSMYSEVAYRGVKYLCVVRKTLSKLSTTGIIVGDLVRFTDTSTRDDADQIVGAPGGVVESVLARRTVLTRADSFKGTTQRPIVANADQMLIVASLRQPRVKWGLIDRMLVAARSGGLQPIVCLNKIDLADGTAPEADDASGRTDAVPDASIPEDLADARRILEHYNSLGILTLQASVARALGYSELRDVLRDRVTVLSGHSGVGKSSLITAIQPQLDLRVGEVSEFTEKGRHTTTSARRYPLDFGGAVIDTPGVKQFGLWQVTRERLAEFYPDVAAGTAPAWRQRSHDRIAESLAG